MLSKHVLLVLAKCDGYFRCQLDIYRIRNGLLTDVYHNTIL